MFFLSSFLISFVLNILSSKFRSFVHSFVLFFFLLVLSLLPSLSFFCMLHSFLLSFHSFFSFPCFRFQLFFLLSFLLSLLFSHPVDWACRIHRLHRCWGIRLPANKYPGYSINISDGKALVLELWGMWVPFQCHNSQVHFVLDWEYDLRYPLHVE